ncbi:MAG TPA: EamA family transporter [Gemmatimonadaceae bacterium]|nr:EamA family transporter [Gemmatimonadaceae bacterium]
MPDAPRGRVALAFAIVYVFWGSTYLGIKYAVETMPPVFMAAVRFLVAGAIVYVWARSRGHAAPRLIHWRSAAVVGGLLMGANAGVAIAELRIPSGVAALIVATSAIWFVLFEWLRPDGKRPTAGVVAGLVVGLAGVAVLIGPGGLIGGPSMDVVGVTIVLVGTLMWVAGSMFARYSPRPESAFMTTASQMLAGGAILLVASIVTGDAARFSWSAVSSTSLWALVYLIIFGSLIGYSAYVYLLVVSTPAKVSTYAYVNPMVAVFLGWAIADEPLSPRVLVASAIILGAVALITSAEVRRPPATPTNPREGIDEMIRRHTDEMPVPEGV